MATSDAQALLLQVSADLSSLERQMRRAGVIVEQGAHAAESHLTSMGRNVEGSLGRVGAAFRAVFDSSRLRVLEEGGARISVFGSALEHLGPAGIAAGAGIAALALGLEQAHQAGEFATALTRAATAAHVSTTALQEYRFALRAAGGEERNADEALASFAVTLGNAQGGMRRAALAFHQIGIGPEELRNIHGVDAGIQAVAEHLGHLDTAARAAALSRVGLAGMAPLVEAGVERMREFRAEAERIGVVMDENVIRRAAAANEQFETLAQVVHIQLMTAFADLAPVLNTLVEAAAHMAQIFGDIVSSISTVERRTQSYLERRHQVLIAESQPTLGNQALDLLIPTRRADRIQELEQTDLELGRRQNTAVTPPAVAGDHLTPPPSHQAHAPEDHSQQALDQAMEALLTAQRAELEAQLANTHDVEERGRIQDQIIGLERQQQAAALRKRIDALEADRHITAAARAEAIGNLRAADLIDQHVANLRTQAQDDQTALDASAHDLAIVTQSHGYSLDILNAQQGMATTMQERREIETRILRIRQQEERDALEQQIAEQHLRPDEAGRLRQGLGDRQQSEITSLNFNTRGPLEQLSATIPRTAAEMNEALQNVAATGLTALTNGLVDAITHVHSLGDAFKQVVTQIIADLLRIEIQRGIEGPLLNILGSVLGVPAASALSPISVVPGGISIPVGANAGGTDNWRGGLTLIGERGPELLNLPRGAQIMSNDKLRAMAAGGHAGRLASDLRVSINLEGANGDETIRRIAYQAAAQGVQQAVAISRKQAPSWVAQRQTEGRNF